MTRCKKRKKQRSISEILSTTLIWLRLSQRSLMIWVRRDHHYAKPTHSISRKTNSSQIKQVGARFSRMANVARSHPSRTTATWCAFRNNWVSTSVIQRWPPSVVRNNRTRRTFSPAAQVRKNQWAFSTCSGEVGRKGATHRRTKTPLPTKLLRSF